MYFLKKVQISIIFIIAIMIITVFAFFKNFRSEPKREYSNSENDENIRT